MRKFTIGWNAESKAHQADHQQKPQEHHVTLKNETVDHCIACSYMYGWMVATM